MDQAKFVEHSLQKIWSEMVWLSKADHITSNFLKAIFHNFYLVHSWIPWSNYIISWHWSLSVTPEDIRKRVVNVFRGYRKKSVAWNGLIGMIRSSISASISCFCWCCAVLGPLTDCIHSTILNGVFPDELKLADISPLYKNSDPKDKTN